MIDIHSHILPGIDDGSKSMDESLAILKKMEELGFTEIVCTPHYIELTKFRTNNVKKRELLKKTQAAAKKAGINIKLHLGNEIFVSRDIVKFLKKNEAMPINKKYVLFELPFTTEINNLGDIIFNIKVNGYTPILAHPERYLMIQKDIRVARKLKEKGVKLQCNYSSITGQYGKKPMKAMKKLLKNGLVDYLGSDVHRARHSFYGKFPKMLKRIKRIAGEEYFEKIEKDTASLIK